MTKVFLSQTQQIIACWLLSRGYTIGVADIIADEATMDQINRIITTAKNQVKELVVQAQSGILEAQPGQSVTQVFENQVNKALNKARDTAGLKVAQSLKDSNNIKTMVSGGSKGSPINISQVCVLGFPSMLCCCFYRGSVFLLLVLFHCECDFSMRHTNYYAR